MNEGPTVCLRVCVCVNGHAGGASLQSELPERVRGQIQTVRIVQRGHEYVERAASHLEMKIAWNASFEQKCKIS